MKNLCNHHKNNSVNPGFSLVEVVIALAFVGMLMTSIFALLSSSMRSTYDSNSLVSRIFYIKDGFFDPEYQQSIQKDVTKPLTKSIDDPKTELSFKASKPKNKILEQKFKNTYLVTSEGTWTDFAQEEEIIVGLQFVAPKKEEKK